MLLQGAGREFGYRDQFMDRPVSLNLKKGEFAKPGKPGRIVCDLGTPASIRSGWLITIIKEACTAVEDIVNSARLVYVKSPDMEFMSEQFNLMRTKSHFVYHSDDSCLALECLDGMLWLNLDISSCDSSNGTSVFNELLQVVPDTLVPEISTLLDQCRAKCRVNGTKLDYEPVEFFEYSGTTLTTLLNNIASRTIGAQLLAGHIRGTKEEVLANVNRILDVCGWKCTVDVCSSLEELQFLKCSPLLGVDGAYHSCLNLGVILRCFGQCYGDLPGRGPIAIRGYEHNCGLVAGLVHAGETSLLHALRRRFPPRGQTAIHTNASQSLENGSPSYIMDQSVSTRYGITLVDYQELINSIDASSVGDFVDVAASRTILQMDYGL